MPYNRKRVQISNPSVECFMPMFIRKMLHAAYLKIMTVVVFFAPSLWHTVFAGTGSSVQLC